MKVVLPCQYNTRMLCVGVFIANQVFWTSLVTYAVRSSPIFHSVKWLLVQLIQTPQEWIASPSQITLPPTHPPVFRQVSLTISRTCFSSWVDSSFVRKKSVLPKNRHIQGFESGTFCLEASYLVTRTNEVNDMDQNIGLTRLLLNKILDASCA